MYYKKKIDERGGIRPSYALYAVSPFSPHDCLATFNVGCGWLRAVWRPGLALGRLRRVLKIHGLPAGQRFVGEAPEKASVIRQTALERGQFREVNCFKNLKYST